MKSVDWLPVYRYTGNDAGGLKFFIFWEPFPFRKELLERFILKSIFEKVSDMKDFEEGLYI